MGDAGGAKDIPVGALNRILVAHHQCRNQSGVGALADALEDPVAHLLTPALHRMPGGACQALRRRIPWSGTHIARRLQALLPEPELIVKAMRVAGAVRRLQPHRHLPALARADRCRLTLQLPRRRCSAFSQVVA